MSNDELELKGATSETTAIKRRGPGWRGFAGHLSAALLLFPRNEETAFWRNSLGELGCAAIVYFFL